MSKKPQPNGQVVKREDGLYWEHFEGQPLYPKPAVLNPWHNHATRRALQAKLDKAKKRAAKQKAAAARRELKVVMQAPAPINHADLPVSEG